MKGVNAGALYECSGITQQAGPDAQPETLLHQEHSVALV